MSRIRSGMAPLIAAACAAALAHASPVSAQVSLPAGLTPQKTAEMVPNLAVIGVGAVPDYVGSDDYTWAAAPALYYKFGNSNRYVDWWGVFGSVNLIDSPTWSAGPTLQFRPGRKDVDDAVVKRMSEIDNSWEAGVFVGYQHINTQGIPWIARVSGGVQWNISDEYDDPYWWASGQFFFPLREDLFVGLGGGVGGGSSSYNQTYFLREDGCLVYAYDRVSGLPPVSELPPIDLLVTDTIEPRDGGIAFAEAWHRARPHVPVLVVTTDPALAWDTGADCRGGVEIRRKPIDYGRIRSTLHALCPRLPGD